MSPWYRNFESERLYVQLKNELIKCLPPATDEHSQANLESLKEYTIDFYLNIATRKYLALLLSSEDRNQEIALSRTVEDLDISLDPNRAVSYCGCYLYNLTSDESLAMPIKLAYDVEIRLSTFEDVVRLANFDRVDGQFLPPPYILTVRNNNRYAPLIAISGHILDNNEGISLHDTVIAVLRLYQLNYVGRGIVYCWKEGLDDSFNPRAAATDSTALTLIRENNPPYLGGWSEYKVDSYNINAIKQTLNLVRSLIPFDENVRRVIRFLGKNEPDWVTLYRVHEIVGADVGGNHIIVRAGWITETKQDSFKHTANHPLAVGDEARHGHLKSQPPKIPMEFTEARELIRNVVLQWLHQKEQSLRQIIETAKGNQVAHESQYLDSLAKNYVHLSDRAFRSPDKLIILVRYKGKYGAIQPLEQSFFNGRGYIRYAWWFQPGNSMDFITGEPEFGFGYAAEGYANISSALRIGPIDLGWSAAGEGFGYFYFGPSSNLDADYELTVTNESNISFINIADYTDKFAKPKL